MESSLSECCDAETSFKFATNDTVDVKVYLEETLTL